MIDEFDYKEPLCPLSGGEEFYHPKKDAPLGHIPVGRVIERVDTLFDRNNVIEAGRLLVYWRNEAIALRDRSGELAMESELIGYYRKQNEREQGLTSVARALVLIEELEQGDMASGATILINCATAYKAFGMAADALPLYLRAEKIYHAILPDGDERFGGLYNNMALTLVDLGRFEEAEAAYHKALSVMERIVAAEAECAITYINLAHMYEDCGQPERIDDCMQHAAALLQSDALPHDGSYAFVLEKCAPSFAYFGDVERCEAMKKEAQTIYERT